MGRLTEYDLQGNPMLCMGGCSWIELLRKLAHYEDLEEAGRLIELPCKFGDTVYEIHYDFPDDDYTYSCPYYYIHEVKFTIDSLAGWEEWVFLTKEEAEAKLKELTT